MDASYRIIKKNNNRNNRFPSVDVHASTKRPLSNNVVHTSVERSAGNSLKKKKVSFTLTNNLISKERPPTSETSDTRGTNLTSVQVDVTPKKNSFFTSRRLCYLRDSSEEKETALLHPPPAACIQQ